MLLKWARRDEAQPDLIGFNFRFMFRDEAERALDARIRKNNFD